MTIKDFIIRQVTHLQGYESAGIRNLENTVDVFLKVLEYKIEDEKLAGTGERILNSLKGLVNNGTYESALDSVTTLNRTETYARVVLFLVDPEKLGDIRDERRGFAPILKALGFSANQVSKMGDRRNEESPHEAAELSIDEIYAKINRFLLDYIRITEVKINELSRLVSASEKEDYFPGSYLKNVVREYENQEGFRYMDFHWHEEKDGSEECNANDLLYKASIDKTQGIKILGEAGTGKTTVLKRMQYQLAKNYKTNSDKIPIFITLSELNAEIDSLLNRIMDITRMGNEDVRKELKNGNFVLFLDGFNEILNDETRRMLAKEINTNFQNYYEKTLIFISDRTITSESTRVMNKSLSLHLCKITIEEKMRFFEERVTSEEMNLIRQRRENVESYFDTLDTPLKLMNFIEVVKSEKAIPDDITSSYINMLFERERNDNKDVKMGELQDLLCALALYISKEEEDVGTFNAEEKEVTLPTVGKLKALQVLAEVKRALDYRIENEHFERVTAGMKLLNWESHLVGFTSREFLVYFKFEALDLDGMDEMIDRIAKEIG